MFHNCSTIEDGSNKNYNIFRHILNSINCIMKGKALMGTILFVKQLLQNHRDLQNRILLSNKNKAKLLIYTRV
jgi:hypothetical protein